MLNQRELNGMINDQIMTSFLKDYSKELLVRALFFLHTHTLFFYPVLFLPHTLLWSSWWFLSPAIYHTLCRPCKLSHSYCQSTWEAPSVRLYHAILKHLKRAICCKDDHWMIANSAGSQMRK